MKKLAYPRNEKLKQKTEISLLFQKGKWKSCGNLRIIVWKNELYDSNDAGTKKQKVGFSVSKKYFKKAVHRNRIKRLLRESYRLNKEAYVETFGEDSVAMLFWISPKLPSHFREVEEEFLNLCKSKK